MEVFWGIPTHMTLGVYGHLEHKELSPQISFPLSNVTWEVRSVLLQGTRHGLLWQGMLEFVFGCFEQN